MRKKIKNKIALVILKTTPHNLEPPLKLYFGIFGGMHAGGQ